MIGIVSTGNKYCDDQYPVSVFTRVSAVAADSASPSDSASGVGRHGAPGSPVEGGRAGTAPHDAAGREAGTTGLRATT